MHALRYVLLLVLLVFGRVVFGGSASLLDWIWTFWQSAFSVTWQQNVQV